MADDGLVIVLAAALDIALTRGAKRHVWVRVINIVGGLLFIGMIAGLIYITLRYS